MHLAGAMVALDADRAIQMLLTMPTRGTSNSAYWAKSANYRQRTNVLEQTAYYLLCSPQQRSEIQFDPRTAPPSAHFD
jgi:hypothetical protein